MEEDEELTDDELKEEAAKNKAKSMIGKGAGKIKKLATKAIVFILKKYGKWVAIVLAVLILFVILFNQFEKVIFNDVLSSVKKATGAEEINFTTNANIVKKDGTYCLQIDASVMEQIEKNLEEAKVKPKDLNLDDFDCFREFIKAEIATQYPQLGNIDKEKYKDSKDIITDGVIKIKRATSGNDAKQLYYIPEADFQKKCDANDSDALNYFTLNKDREIVIASYSKTDSTVTTSGDTSITTVPTEEHTYTITTQSLDYLSIVEKYTMSFSLLLAILQTSDSEEMALEFAKLAQESEMEITIQDNIEINTSDEHREVKQYIDGGKTITYQVTITDENGVTTIPYVTTGIDVDKQEKTGTVDIHTVTETNTPHLELTKVDCWLAKFENTYTYKDNSQNPDSTTGQPYDSEQEEAIQCDINTDTDVANFISKKESEHKTDKNTVVVNKWDLIADVKKVTKTTTKVDTSTVNQEYSTTKSEAKKNDEKVFSIFNGNVAGDDKELAEKLKEGYGSLYDAQEWFYGLLKKGDQDKIDIMKYFIKKFHNDPDAQEYDTSLYNAEDFESAGGTGGVFGCNLTREEFIKKAKAYKKNNSTYQNYMANYAGDFYDVCTLQKYNVNPCLAYAHACLETGDGSSSGCKNDKNYFGMAHGNDAASGKGYSSVRESVEDYCKWILQNATPGNSAYEQSVAVSKKYARYNKAFSGDPSTNAYDLYSRYAYLGDTHVTSDSDYTVEWGKGGRTYTRVIYGGYDYSSATWSDEANYRKKCGNKHPNASDKTTIEEQADYAEYSMNKRTSIATSIFGEDALSSGGDILSVAKTIHTYMEKNGYAYCTYGKEKDTSHGGKGGSHGLNSTFEESKKGYKLTCCATYISWVLYDAGYTKLAGMHGCGVLSAGIMSNYKYKKITNKSELKPGDICFKGGEHVQMYGEDGVWYNAGSNNAISKSPYAYPWNEWTFALRLLE